MIRKILLLAIALFIISNPGFAQAKDSTASFKIGGYVDAYYAYFTDSVGTNKYQQFPVWIFRCN